MTNEELVKQYQEGSNKALEELIKSNSGLIHIVAKKYYTNGTASVDCDDLVQEGTVGFIEAAKRYDLYNQHKAKFSSYAIVYVRGYISRFINQRNTTNESSLNEPAYADDGNDVEVIDTIVDDNDVDKYQSIWLCELRNEVNKAMRSKLTLRQRQVLELRYGFGCEECTIGEINQILQCGNARNIHDTALITLRQRAPYLREFL